VKIAVVGSGISGLACAHLLKEDHEVTLFEADAKPGGHVNTIEVSGKTGTYQVDTGFIVFNEQNYPNFVRLIEQLGVESQATRMGFSVRSDKLGLEYSGESFRGLFGHLRNATDPLHWKMALDIMHFHKLAKEKNPGQATVDEFLKIHGFGNRFKECFLLPLGAALWSCSTTRFGEFPMEFVMNFLANHQMLQAANRPVWRVLKGGSRTYVDKIVEQLGTRLLLNSPVQEIRREKEGVHLGFPDGTSQSFEEVILACHADQALRLIVSPSADEVALLKSFPYEKNMVSLHSDDSLLPRRKSARASWNAYLSKESKRQAVVTYDMNILQDLPTDEPFCVSLNQRNEIRESAMHREFEFSHPTFHQGRKEAQERHGSFIRNRGISLCGAYWGYGFHEDGLNSGLRVCEAFGASLE
jgi:predicted NAD/FAD-binding protein